MDSYLEIAERVLRASKRPMTSHGILKAAYQSGIVPQHLYGKTQHKTLQARISTDIISNKLESRFYRTDPGYFFLSEFRSDPKIPDRYKDPYHARRRTRDLVRSPALAVDRSFFDSHAMEHFVEWQQLVNEAKKAGALKYVDPSDENSDSLPVWAFSIVRRDDKLLSYCIGRYRNSSDSFLNKRSIGFPEMISYYDKTLFSSDDFGASERGLNTILTDLDLSRSVFTDENDIHPPAVSVAIYIKDCEPCPALLFVMEWECPVWFEPTSRRLSLNDVRWIDSTRAPNDLDGFEPWSRAAFTALQKANKRAKIIEENY